MPKLPHILEKIGGSEKIPKKDFFWALLIWGDGVKSAIWTVEEGKTKVVALGGWQEWSGESSGDLTNGVDKSFTVCSQRFEGMGEEPEKVIFGLPESWTEGKNIKKDRQELLQEVCQKLELKPVGFVSTFDAITFHLKKIEGIPLSAILVRLGKEKLLVAVCQVGKTLKVEEVVRSEDLAADTCEGLLRFEAETLPSRMLLFDSEDMEEARQALTAFHWEKARVEGKKLPFLHFPKIEVLPADFDINAVSLSGGTEVAKSLGFAIAREERVREEKKEEVAIEGKKQVQLETPPEEVVIPEGDLGFVKGKDILAEAPREEKAVAEEEEKEVLEKPEPVPEEPEEKELEEIEVEEVKKEEERRFRPRFPLPLLFLNLGKRLSGLSLPGGTFLVAILLAVTVLLASSFLWLIWYYPKASITIFVTPKILEEEILLAVDPTQEVLDEESRVLPSVLVEAKEAGERQKETTGQKTVGEKAGGEVTIYNRISTPKTFPKETLLVGPGGLKFSLDREVSVASKTPDLESGVDKWGEAKVSVVATDIGAQFNLASDSQFTVEDFPSSSFLAKNESAFTGGTSRQIQAVSEEDQEDLLDLLGEELEEKGKGALLGSVSEGEKLIESSLSSKVEDKDFSHEVGDEAKTLSCSLTVKVSALTYSQENFLKIAQKALGEKIPEGYELRKDEVEARFSQEEKKEDGSYLFRVFLKANLLPKVDTDEISAKVKGKRPYFASKYFEELPGFVKSEIIMKPRLPSFLQFLPRSKEKIGIEVRGY